MPRARPAEDKTPRRPKGAGSVTRVKGRDDYWHAVRSVDGTRHDAFGSSAEDAWNRLTEKIRKAGQRVPGDEDPQKVTVAEYTLRWLERRQAEIGRGLERKSWESHERALNHHLLPTIGDRPLARLTAAELETLYSRLLSGTRPLSVKYMRDINGTLRLALKRLPRDFHIPNPAADVDLPRREKLTVQYPLRPSQMRRFWEVAKDDSLAALWLLASYFPSRSGELRGLKWTDWNERERTLLLQRGLQGVTSDGDLLEKEGGKTSSNARVLELDDTMTVALQAHRAAQHQQRTERQDAGEPWDENGLMFRTRSGRAIESNNLLRHFRRLLQAANLPTHHRVHDLRHTAVHNLLLAGVPLPEVSGAAGHANPGVTSTLYAQSVRRVRAGIIGTLASFYAADGTAAEDGDAPPVRRARGQTVALSPAQLAEAKQLRAADPARWTQALLGRRYGVSPSTINRALLGKVGRPVKRQRAERSQRQNTPKMGT